MRSNDSKGPQISSWTAKTLIRLGVVFAGRTCHFVGLVLRRLKYNKMNVISMLNVGSFPYRPVRLTLRVSLSTYSVSSKDS